ncbi:MAG: CcdB family protein [Zoogloeaceae bacterium]|nr:CcdB family protein [Zoogloeaceae bacterium]
MAQYDVYTNPNAQQQRAFPYLVELQSDQLRHYSTRLLMPLARLPDTLADLPRRLTETVEVDGERFYLAAHLCAPFPAQLLRRPVTSLRHEASLFVDALDAVISGI